MNLLAAIVAMTNMCGVPGGQHRAEHRYVRIAVGEVRPEEMMQKG